MIFVSTLCLLFIATFAFDKGFEHVTFGSTIKLKHSFTNYKLHSHEITYGTGSTQQSVTSTPNEVDHNSYWMVVSAYNTTYKRGSIIKCGTKIRLLHIATNKYLHSHLFESPLTKRQEVSAFGTDGMGDTGDDWMVECNGEWMREQKIQLKHIDTKKYLSTGNYPFRSSAVKGQNEVHCKSNRDKETDWFSWFGVYIENIQVKEDECHTEL